MLYADMSMVAYELHKPSQIPNLGAETTELD